MLVDPAGTGAGLPADNSKVNGTRCHRLVEDLRHLGGNLLSQIIFPSKLCSLNIQLNRLSSESGALNYFVKVAH